MSNQTIQVIRGLAMSFAIGPMVVGLGWAGWWFHPAAGIWLAMCGAGVIVTMLLIEVPVNPTAVVGHNEKGSVTTENEFVEMLALVMASDPWPLDSDNEKSVKAMMDREARARGFEDWVHAYHEDGEPG